MLRRQSHSNSKGGRDIDRRRTTGGTATAPHGQGAAVRMKTTRPAWVGPLDWREPVDSPSVIATASKSSRRHQQCVSGEAQERYCTAGAVDAVEKSKDRLRTMHDVGAPYRPRGGQHTSTIATTTTSRGASSAASGPRHTVPSRVQRAAAAAALATATALSRQGVFLKKKTKKKQSKQGRSESQRQQSTREAARTVLKLAEDHFVDYSRHRRRTRAYVESDQGEYSDREQKIDAELRASVRYASQTLRTPTFVGRQQTSTRPIALMSTSVRHATIPAARGDGGVPTESQSTRTRARGSVRTTSAHVRVVQARGLSTCRKPRDELEGTDLLTSSLKALQLAEEQLKTPVGSRRKKRAKKVVETTLKGRREHTSHENDHVMDQPGVNVNAIGRPKTSRVVLATSTGALSDSEQVEEDDQEEATVRELRASLSSSGSDDVDDDNDDEDDEIDDEHD